MQVNNFRVIPMPQRKSAGKSSDQRSGGSKASARRSPCPVSCALDLFGDRWTLLVVRDLVLGKTRFKEFTGSPEGIPTNILSERLERLQQGGIVEQVPATAGGKRMAYALTEKGRSLKPVIKMLRDWGLKWEEGTRVERGDLRFDHER